MQRASKHHSKGGTLLETLVAMAIGGMVLAICMSNYLFLAKSTKSLANYSEFNSQSRFFLEFFGQDVRSATEVIEASPDYFRINVEKEDGTIIEIAYTYDSKNKRIVRSWEALQRTLVSDVVTCNFEFLDRNGPAVHPSHIRQIAVDAILWRKVLQQDNTQETLSAAVTLRNRT